MIQFRISVGLAVLCGVMIGCAQKSEVASNEPATVEKPNGITPEEPAKPIDLASLPAELKNDAFEYYGLGRTTPLKLVAKFNNTTRSGAQTVTLTKVADGKAEFKIENTGDLSFIGTTVVGLEAGGIRVISSDTATPTEGEYELPSGLSKGKTWKTTTKMDKDGQSLNITTTNTVEGTVAVKTPVGEYKDALLVVAKGEGTRNGTKISIVNKNWFVKGRGAVRAEVVSTPAGGAKETVVLEEVKE